MIKATKELLSEIEADQLVDHHTIGRRLHTIIEEAEAEIADLISADTVAYPEDFEPATEEERAE